MTDLVQLDHPFTTAQARAAGWTPGALRRAASSGEIVRLLKGVYVGAGVELSIEVRCAAASLVVSPHSVVCDRTAAWVHGANVYGLREPVASAPLETCVLRSHSPSRRAGVDGRTRDLAPHDLMETGGVTVTTPVRTALDLGCALPRSRALGAMDKLARLHGFTAADLLVELPRFGRRRGVVQLRQLVAIVDGRSESMRESWVRLLIHDAQLPPPELQWWICVDGVPTYRLDIAYPDHKLAIEYDGEDYHLLTPEQLEHDADRRAWLRANGWTVIVLTKADLDGSAEGSWLREVRAALRPQTKRFRWTRERPSTDPTRD